MTWVRVKDTGSIGVVRDLSEHEVPNNAWTEAQNVRFLDGYATKFLGHGRVYGTPSVEPHHVAPVNVGGARYWLYASQEKIYATTVAGGSVTHTNLTRQTGGSDVNYSAGLNTWTSTLLGGIPIFNPGNTTDPPQQWDTALETRFTALSAWPANTYCKSMRAFRNILIALNVTKDGNSFPYMVKWSHPADPGSVPISWDIDDPTKDSGEFDLSEGYDQIIDGMQLRDVFIVYKEASVWRLDYVGGAFVLQANKVLGMSGALNRNCVVEVDGFHVVLTNNDVVIHDGNTATSILDKRTRRWLFQNIDVEAVSSCFVFKNPFFNEVYICYPSIGQSVPDKAVVYNYVDKTVSQRDLPNVRHASFGPVSEGLSGSWGSDNDPWSSDTTKWGGPDVVPAEARVLMGSSSTLFYMLDTSQSFDGTLPVSLLERVGLSFGAPEKVKLIRSVRPRIKGQKGGTVKVYIGAQDDPYETPIYTEMTHNIGITVNNDCLVAGRYIAVKFETGTSFDWRLDSYDIDVEIQGNW